MKQSTKRAIAEYQWLVWVGEQFLEFKDIWSQYARRLAIPDMVSLNQS